MKNDDIKQSLTNEIGEAPSSATLSVVTPKGYNTLFTLREMSGEVLLKKITALENKLEELGYKPQTRQVFGAKKEVEYVEGKKCPIDSGKLKVIVAKKDGKIWWSCDNGHYDFATKVTSGCKFICSPESYDSKVAEIKNIKETQQIDIPEDFNQNE